MVCKPLLSALCLVLPMLAHADFQSTWPLDGRIALISSAAANRSNEDNLKSGGGQLGLNLAPILGWSDSRWLLLPAVELDYNSANTILKVEDERFEFLQQNTVRLDLAAAFRRTPSQRFGLRVFGETFQAKQAANEDLATGQYNYQDSGIGLDWRQKWGDEQRLRSTLGLTATDRRYPHWQSLDPGQRSEKDQAITRLYTDVSYKWSSLDASTELGISMQNVDYKAGLTIDSTGTTEAAIRRKDAVLDLSLRMPLRLGRHDVMLGVGFESWDSNLNIFDVQNGYYLPNYNDFLQASADIGYAYSFDGPWWFLDSPQLSLDVALELRQYSVRPARNIDGTLRDVAERDFTRNVTLGFNSAVSEHWACFFQVNQQAAASNNYDQTSALYSYLFNTVSLGANFSY